MVIDHEVEIRPPLLADPSAPAVFDGDTGALTREHSGTARPVGEGHLRLQRGVARSGSVRCGRGDVRWLWTGGLSGTAVLHDPRDDQHAEGRGQQRR